VQFMLCYGHADVPSRLDHEGYPVVRLGVDALVPVTAPDADRRPLHEIGRTEPLPVLDYSDASGLGRILRSRKREIFADGARADPRHAVSIVFTAHNAFLLRTMALAGRGVAWLPASLVEGELEQGALVAAGDERWRVPVEIRLYRQKAGMAPTAEELWRVVGGGTERR
jgi:LysR family transcriptional regulator, hypochlorite-specific transcription factor HypT